MLYREAGQYKTSYQSDQAIFPIAQDRWVVWTFVAVAFLVVKFPLALGLITLLAWVFDGLSVAFGMGAMVFAVFVRGFVNLLRTPDTTANDAPQRS